ncbi:MAG: VPDSG-CTERM sorting domain-containing protein [Verrucomicrobiota bacterium]
MISKIGRIVGNFSLTAAASLVLAQVGTAASIPALSGGYDVFVRNGAVFDGVHMHGATAIGGDLSLTGNMSEFLNDPVTRPSGLSVGGRILQGADARINNSGKLHVGSLVSGQTVSANSLQSGSGRNVYFGSGQPPANVVTAQAVDMVSAFNQLSALSASLAAKSSTLNFSSFVSGSNFNLTLQSGSLIGYDVMNITGAQLASVGNLNFNHVSGFDQKLVINVDLSNYNGGAFIQNRNGNDEANNILWNFFGASQLSLQNQFIGTILAPNLNLTHYNNDIKGSVIANSFTKTGGQVHVHPFSFDFPTPASTSTKGVPDAGSTGLLALLVLPLLVAFRRWA